MKNKLITGFGGLLAVCPLLGLRALSGFRTLSRFTVVLCEHPLAVRGGRDASAPYPGHFVCRFQHQGKPGGQRRRACG